jgi:hypothetical protein
MEIQNDAILWFRRRINDPETMDFLKDIVEEGYEYVNPCTNNNFKSYLDDIVYGSVQTFIQSYDALYKTKSDMRVLESYIYKFIEFKFVNSIKENYDYWIENCDETINESHVPQRTTSLILRLYEEGKSIKKINEITGIPFETIILSIKDYDGDIDCKMAYNLFNILFSYTDLLKTKIVSSEGYIELHYDRFAATLEYEYSVKEYVLNGYATPYWGGECMLPIDNTNYYDKKTDNDEDDDWSTSVRIPKRFYNISELIDWFNDDYFQLLSEILKQWEA